MQRLLASASRATLTVHPCFLRRSVNYQRIRMVSDLEQILMFNVVHSPGLFIWMVVSLREE